MKMGLPPLEYIDCFLDSPNFRDVITLYEKELDGNAVLVKSLVKECRRMIQATEGQQISYIAPSGTVGSSILFLCREKGHLPKTGL